MKRVLTTAAAAIALLAVAACGSTTSVGSPSSSSGGQGAGNGRVFARNGAAGELVQLGGTTLVLNTQSGDVTVLYSSSTQIQKTSTGTVADIVPGVCIVASGQKDSAGAVTASTVRVSDAVNGSCAVGRGPGGDLNRPSPNPSFTPRAQPANVAFVGGEVTAVAGTSVTLTDSAGASHTITVPTTVRVARSSSASASDLSVGDCVLANGSKDSTGKVSARTLNIVPAGPSGCFTGGGFGGFGRDFGGGGGGGFGGGGGGAAGGAPPPFD